MKPNLFSIFLDIHLQAHAQAQTPGGIKSVICKASRKEEAKRIGSESLCVNVDKKEV